MTTARKLFEMPKEKMGEVPGSRTKDDKNKKHSPLGKCRATAQKEKGAKVLNKISILFLRFINS